MKILSNDFVVKLYNLIYNSTDSQFRKYTTKYYEEWKSELTEKIIKLIEEEL